MKTAEILSETPYLHDGEYEAPGWNGQKNLSF